MNQYNSKLLQINLSSISFWLGLMVIASLLGAVGLGWLVNSVLILLGLLLLTPIIAFVGLRWWLQRNLTQGQCPVCQTGLTGLNRTQIQCSNCQELLQVEAGQFVRITPPGTIEVQAVDISAQRLDNS